jgi:hypothetical protein
VHRLDFRGGQGETTIITEQFSRLNNCLCMAEQFGPGYFVGLGLRLKSEIRTRTKEIVTFLHLTQNYLILGLIIGDRWCSK